MSHILRVALGSLIVWLLLSAGLSAAEVEAQSRIDAVTVYPDGATVTRVIQINVPQGNTTLLARDFPLSLDRSSLQVEGEASTHLVIGDVNASTPSPERPVVRAELERQIESLRDQIAAFDDKIAAATARKNFVIRFSQDAPARIGDKAGARPLSELRAAFTAVAEEVAAADEAIRKAKLQQRDLNRDLARLKAQRNVHPPRKMEVRIDLSADATARAALRVSYSVRGARWLPMYDARLDSGTGHAKPSLELIRRAQVIQNTGEDWTNAALSASTVRTTKGGDAPELRPLIVRFYEPPRAPMPVAATKMEAEHLAGEVASRVRDAAKQRPVEEREATIETGGFQVVYRIPRRVTVAANEGAKSFRIASAEIAPELIRRAAPILDNTAFLEASFKHDEEAPLLPGRIAIYRDGIFIGFSRMTLTPKGETVRLGFGADELVKIVRVPVRQIEGSTGIISTSKIDEREFKITVHNGHAEPIHISVEDRVPVSEVDDVTVELLPITTLPTQHNVRDRRGVISWDFDAKPGEQREIKLGWRVQWPNNRKITYQWAAPMKLSE
jgi:uncharacterized protein (TIGR02231 family)